ncbi:unnamed protein product [Nippostrongylus brasiliensis]|uniref:Uncharacterized protein n=1 Tax=Nippostrongylus brasiliensis TaxID=27835 RepID=A0A0N4YMP0_NIPBR|nr:unnamed protein product [Nippostrongylus brasiliensis]
MISATTLPLKPPPPPSRRSTPRTRTLKGTAAAFHHLPLPHLVSSLPRSDDGHTVGYVIIIIIGCVYDDDVSAVTVRFVVGFYLLTAF